MTAATAVFTATPDAQNLPQSPVRKGFLKSAFAKVADLGGSLAVSGSFKIAAASVVAGAGASVWLTVGATALATGLGASVYTLGKMTYSEWRAAKAEGRSMRRVLTKDNLADVAKSFVVASLGGAFGSWLAGSDLGRVAAGLATGTSAAVMSFGQQTYAEWRAAKAEGRSMRRLFNRASMKQTVMAFAAGSAIGSLASFISEPGNLQKTFSALSNFFLGSAQAAEIPMGFTQTAGLAPALPMIAADDLATAEPQPVELRHPSAVETESFEATNIEQNALQKLSAAVAAAGPVPERLTEILNTLNLDDPSTARGWQLKDLAHFVLRTEGIPMADRLQLAYELANEAQARGNAQAAGFIKDLERLGFTPESSEAPVTAPAATPAAPAAPVAPVSPDAPTAMAEQPQETSFKKGFAAATCYVSEQDQNRVSYTRCQTVAEVMQPNDYILFLDATGSEAQWKSGLTYDSHPVETSAFIRSPAFSRGVENLIDLRESQTQYAAVSPKW